MGLRFLGTPEELGIGTGDRISFTALFIAQGPITAIPTPMPTPTPTDPRRGGTLRLAEGWSWRGAMDFISSGVFQAVMLNQTGNLLIQYNPESDDPLELVGDLATGWEVGADGKSYTFTLNPKAKWHDGVPVTAADIKWTLDTGAFPEMDEPRWFWAFYADSYKSSTVIDAKTVRVDLKFPSPAFMLYLASVYMQMQPKHHFDGKPLAFREELDNALGSGPFILTDLDPGVSHFYERNPDYWKPGRPYLDGLKYFTIVGGDATIAAYKAGQLQMSRDAAGALSNAEALELAKDEVGRLTVHWGGPMSQIALWLNLDKPPFDNVKVRQAINLVIHRPQFIETLTLGQATLGYPFPPDFWFSPTEAEVTQVPGFRSLNGEKHPDDIAEAQRLMAEAGFADGFETNFLARNLFGTPEMAQVAADQLRRTLNITGTVDVVDLNVEQTRRTAGDWEILPQSVATNMLDIEDVMSRLYRSTGPDNFAGYTNARVDELYELQARSLDRAQRKLWAEEVTQIVLEELPVINLYWANRPMVVHNSIKNFHMPTIWMAYNFKMEHLWCDPICS